MVSMLSDQEGYPVSVACDLLELAPSTYYYRPVQSDESELEEAIEEIGQVVEGARTAEELTQLAKRYGIEMPITEQVSRLLQNACTPREAVEVLLSREPNTDTPLD